MMQALQHRADGKLYRIQTPQTPIARTKRYNTYKMDEFPSGMNMIVAVLAYTGGCCAVLCCAVLCCAVLCCAVLCCAVLCTRQVLVVNVAGFMLFWRHCGLQHRTLSNSGQRSTLLQRSSSHSCLNWHCCATVGFIVSLVSYKYCLCKHGAALS